MSMERSLSLNHIATPNHFCNSPVSAISIKRPILPKQRIFGINAKACLSLHHHVRFSQKNESGLSWQSVGLSRRSRVCTLASTTDSASPSSSSSSSDVSLVSVLRGVCFYMVTSAIAIPLFVAMLVAHPLVLMLDKNRRRFHHLVNKFWASITLLLFCKVDIEGLENLPDSKVPALYVANHQSYLDIYALLLLGRSFKFISKTSIFLFPIVGWSMFLTGHIPLHRMDNRSQMECMKRCINALKQGASVLFFPEGTRSKDGKMSQFKKGAFSVAVKAKVPVVPIAIMGTGNIMPRGKEGILKPGSIKIVIEPPIEGTNADELNEKARTEISKQLIKHGFGVH